MSCMQNFSLLQNGFYFSKCTYVCWILCHFKLLAWLNRALSSKEKQLQIFPSILPFFSWRFDRIVSETVRLNRSNVIWDINESIEQKGWHILCSGALLQMLGKHFRNKSGQVWKRLITSSKGFDLKYHMLTDDHPEFEILINCLW